MKKILLLLIFFVMCFKVNAQTSKVIGLDDETFKVLLNQQFTNLITGQSKNSIGNFVSAETKEGELNAAVTAFTSVGSVYSFKLNAGTSDGFAPLFTNSVAASKIGLEFQYNTLGLSEQTLLYTDKSFSKIKNAEKLLLEKFKYDSINAEIGRLKFDMNPEIEKLNKKKNEAGIEKHKLILKIDELRVEIATLRKQADTEKDPAIKDSLLKKIKENELQIEIHKYEVEKTDVTINTAEATINEYPKYYEEVTILTLNKDAAINKLKSELEILGFEFGWLSFSYKIQYNMFKQFFPDTAFADQIKENKTFGNEWRVQYSYYKYTHEPNKSYYFDLGGAISYSDNFSSLKKKEITESKNYGPNPDDRTVTKKYNAYTGDFNPSIWGLNCYGDIFYFFLKDNIIALHGFPELQIRENEKPVANLGIGVLFSAKNIKDEATVNIELYYNSMDLWNVKEADLSFIERNNIGVRFSFPIKFKTNN